MSTEQLDDALLLPRFFVTSRRIGLLAFLRGSDFIDRHGVITARANGIILDKTTRTWRRLPFKTTQSIRFFVLHRFFRQIGVVDCGKVARRLRPVPGTARG